MFKSLEASVESHVESRLPGRIETICIVHFQTVDGAVPSDLGFELHK